MTNASTLYFSQLTLLIKKFISYLLMTNPQESYHTSWKVRAASRVMSLLFAANQSRNDAIPLKDFYNEALDSLDILADFNRWQQDRTGLCFYFCQYPFLVSLKSKLQIQKLDTDRQAFII